MTQRSGDPPLVRRPRTGRGAPRCPPVAAGNLRVRRCGRHANPAAGTSTLLSAGYFGPLPAIPQSACVALYRRALVVSRLRKPSRVESLLGGTAGRHRGVLWGH